MAVTNLEEILRAAGAKEIELPGWEDGETVVFKLRRPGLLNMVSDGSIPNPLLPMVEKLFMGQKEAEQEGLARNAQVIRAIARAALVEPSAAALDEAGVELTDQQYMEIFGYVMQGVNGLRRFRGRKRAGSKPDGAKAALPAEPADRA